jgi:S1-C subfamily serine protease
VRTLSIFSRITLACCGLVGLCAAQKTTDPQHAGSSQVQTSATAGQPAPTAAMLKKMVAFLSLDYRDGVSNGQARGTAFFVFYPDKRVGENGGFLYLVTNKHVAEPEINGHKVAVQRMTLRLNLKTPVDGRESEEVTIPLSNLFHWYFPGDAAVDLAVLPVHPDESRYDYAPVPVAFFATNDVVTQEEISEGDPVLFSGFFYQFPGQRRMEPIVRQGVLAMMPDEVLGTTLGQQGRIYLADVHVFHGNSGAPMFVNVGGYRRGMLTIGGFPYRLLGVVSGYFYETEDLQLQVATTLSGKANANSGISIVVPVDELKNLLDLPELQAQRNASVAHLHK